MTAVVPSESIAFVVERQRRRTTRTLIALALLLALTILLSVGWGAVPIAPDRVILILASKLGLPLSDAVAVREETVLLAIRLPRVVLGVLVGAALAAAGAALQGLFRNPLADPGLIGVSGGAALAAVATIVLGGPLLAALPSALAPYLLPLAAFCGGLLVTALVCRIASRHGRIHVATLLLAGVAINAVVMAGIGFLIFLSDDEQLRTANFWMLGSLGGVTWETLSGGVPFIVAALLALPLFARHLNALLLGETEALHLGFDIERAKRIVVVLAALGTGASVALTGTIGFVGLVVPHLVRLLLGPDHRSLLPASILLGPALLLAADLGARSLVLPAELPIGILTSLVGGPFFLWLLLRRRAIAGW
ncbi:MAG: FecCD family ABC transporter permease [Kiloniellales bacterium]